MAYVTLNLTEDLSDALALVGRSPTSSYAADLVLRVLEASLQLIRQNGALFMNFIHIITGT